MANPPSATINTVAGDDVVNLRESQALVLTGKTDGASVKLTVGGREHVVAANGGTWAYTATAEDVAAMGQGAETVTAVALDGVGAAGATTTHGINVDTIAPTFLSANFRYSSIPLDRAGGSTLNAPSWVTWFKISGRVRYNFDEAVVPVHEDAFFPWITISGAAVGANFIVDADNRTYDAHPRVDFTINMFTKGTSGEGRLYGAYEAMDAAGNRTLVRPTDPVFTFLVKTPLQSGSMSALVVNMAGWAIGSPMTSIKAADETLTLADGSRIGNPLFAVASNASQLGADYAAGKLTLDQAREALIDLAVPTTGVAHDTYLFFTGQAPTSAGMAWLIDSEANPNDLTDAHYAGLNTINRYINLSVGLGTVGEGQAAFAADYGALSFQAAIAKAYETIIGGDAARAAGIDVTAALAWINSQKAYFQALGGGTDLGAKAAMVGYVLSAGEQAHVGAYHDAAHDYIGGLIGLVGASDASFPDLAG